MCVSKVNSPYRVPSRQLAWLMSFVALPYAMYGALLVMTYLMVSAMFMRGRYVWRLCHRWGYGWLSLGLLLSAIASINRGDAFLQLVHFLPFFVLWGVFATNPTVLARPFTALETLARWLVLSSTPLCVLAIGEYLLKFESLIAPIKASPLPPWFIGWLYEEPYVGHRARSLFDHPNTLSAYLVMILGLGLGLLLKTLLDRTKSEQMRPSSSLSLAKQQRSWLAISVILCLVAIFCTGSRNGVLIALVLVAATFYSARRHKWALLLGGLGMGAIAFAVAAFGIGGRSLSLDIFTHDPRIGVWRLAIDMIQQRPLLGWGLSGLREHYVPGSIHGYDNIFHAHNIWLCLASETGIPVTMGFCAIVGTIMYRATHAYLKHNPSSNLSTGERAILLSYLLAFSACLMFALFDVVLFDARLNILSWGLLAALYLLSNKKTVSKAK